MRQPPTSGLPDCGWEDKAPVVMTKRPSAIDNTHARCRSMLNSERIENRVVEKSVVSFAGPSRRASARRLSVAFGANQTTNSFDPCPAVLRNDPVCDIGPARLPLRAMTPEPHSPGSKSLL